MSSINTLPDSLPRGSQSAVAGASPHPRRRLRLLFVVADLCSGGAERQLVTLSRALAQRGHHVEFFVYRAATFFVPMLEEAGIPVHRYVKRRRFSWRLVQRLRELMRCGRFDVALSYVGGPNLWTILAATGLRPRPKIVVSERSSANADRPLHVLVQQTYRLADRLAVNSYHLHQHYSDKYRWIQGRVLCIWNGVDLDRFQITPLPAWQEPFKLLAVGRIERGKNWLCLVEALAILRDEFHISAHVDHVGPLTGLIPDDDLYRAQLHRRIDELGLADRWHWLGEVTDMNRCLSEHHALVHPSTIEGLPNVVCEALACGRPALVSNTLDHPRLVQDGRTGFLFGDSNPRDLAEVIRRLRDRSPAEADQISKSARAFAEERLSTKRLTDEYETLFYDLASVEIL